jgi:hypothetical protein
MKRSFSVLLLLGLIVVACSPQQEAAETPSPTPAPTIEESEAQESQIEGLGAVPTEAIPTEPPFETPVDPTSSPVIEPTEVTAIEPTATLVASAGEEAIFNGPYENTYFRGSAVAPVTMIDYSDFL